jgi:hypothetical protein
MVGLCPNNRKENKVGLTLGKALDRMYSVRIPFLNGYYNIGVYFNKRSTFLLFKVDSDFAPKNSFEKSSKISMFKNLESSRFSETFLDLHNYRNANLDILNQYQDIKPEYYHDVNIIFNETINVSKVEIGEKTLFDTLTLYGLTMSAYSNEFIFIIAERHNIVKKLNKKIVRTTELQISTSASLVLLDDFHRERLESVKLQENKQVIPSDEKEVIRLSDIDESMV